MKRLILVLAIHFLTFVSILSQQKRWPTLLWEISGNGLTSPSYLYGTMHVSGKLAFHLGDPFFDALESVQVVALELNHEKWLADELSEENLLELSASYSNVGFDNYGNSDYGYSEVFRYGIDNKDYLLRPFRFFPRFANHIVSRNRRESVEFEEDSWLDYFIYKSGKKLRKEIFGLESFKESQHAMDLATQYNKTHKDELKDNDHDWGGQNSLFEELESAYRKGDLDKLDSLSNISSKGGWKKFILEYRNEVFVNRIDSILKTKTMFIGMGAAHLPGETGVIEMLRDLGYTLNPVKPGRRNPKKIEALESKEFPSIFSKYSSPSGLFEIDVPGPVYVAPISTEMTVETCADLPNASTLYMMRCKTYAGLRKLSPKDIIHSLDSLLYENIPGTIISQKEVLINGYTAIDLLSKDRLGHYHKYRIISMDQELLVVRLDGHQKLAASRYGDRIFNSIKLMKTASPDWKELTVTDKSLSLKLPSTAIYFSMEYMQNLENNLNISAYDKESESFIQVSRVAIPPLRLEPDEYEISEVEYAFRRERKLRMIERDTNEFLGYPSFDCNYRAEDGSNVKVKYTLVGSMCYLFAVHNPNEEVLDKLYSGIKFSPPTYCKDFLIQTDSTIMARFEIPYKLPKGTEDLFWYSDEVEDDNPYDEKIIQSHYSPLEGSESIDVEYWALGKYSFTSDTTDFEKDILSYYTRKGDYFVVDKEFIEQDSTLVLNLIVGDTSVSRVKRIMAIYQPSSTYVLQTSYDSLTGPSQFVERFYGSFRPCDTIHVGRRFDNRTEHFIRDIQSDDSLTFEWAFELLNYQWLEFDTSTSIFSAMDNISKWATPEERRVIQMELMRYLPDFEDPGVLGYLTEKYKFWADSTDNQAFALGLISSIQTKEAKIRTRDLLLESAPLGIDQSDVVEIFRNLRDSIEICKGIAPSLYPLIEIDEYEGAIYKHIATLLDSNMISKKDYAVLFPSILNKAKIEYRRANSSLNKMQEPDGYSYENWDSGSKYLAKYRNNSMKVLWLLLLPYKDQKEVKEFFETVEGTRHKDILMSLATLYFSKGISVPEAMIDTITSDMQGKIDLFNELTDLDLDSLYPEKYKDQDAMLEHIMRKKLTNYNSDDVDSLVFLRCEPIQFRNRSGELYFYKVRKEKDGEWKLACAGIIPTDHSKLVTNPEFVKTGKGKFDQDKLTQEEQDDAFEDLQRLAIRQIVNADGPSNEEWIETLYEH
jgi:uncharacterized protein YbaP (TraB family)